MIATGRIARLCALLAGTATGLAAAADKPVVANAGPWSATLGPQGIVLACDGETISRGSYVNVFAPGYAGTVLGSRQAWAAGEASAAADGRTVALAATLPGGALHYQATVSEARVRIVLRLHLAAEAVPGPVEYAIAQMPEALLAEAEIETLGVAGTVVARLSLPGESQPGGLANAAPVLRFRTPLRTIVIEALDYSTVFPFDARHERYGERYGIWAFAAPAVPPGQESTVTCEIRIEPPLPPRVPGHIAIAPDHAATAILVPDGATARESLAAGELAAILETMAGRRLPQEVCSGGEVPAGAIAIGAAAVQTGLITRDELATVAPDGYVVRVRGGRAGIAGARDVGTVYGVYALLRHLGCRFYAPGCEDIPRCETVVLPEVLLSEAPFYEFRNLTGNLKLGHTPRDDIMNPAEIGAKGNVVHAAEFLVPYDAYHEEHPEYFALQKDGRRLTRDPQAGRFDVHLCLANPEVRRISAERLLAIMDAQTDRRFFGVSPGDGFAWCECAECKAMDAVPGVDMTDRLLDYVNHVARAVVGRHPEKRILTLAYTFATSPPPTRLRPEPNVWVQYCPYPPRTGCHSHDLTCEKNAQGLADLLGWLEKCPENMAIFDYPTGYQNWYEPFGSFWAMKRKLELYAAHGSRGLYYCGTPQNFRHLFIYVQSRLLWQPETPVEPLIDAFMAAYYGAAAPQVRAYFDFMHREIKERPVHQMCEGPSPHTVTPEWAEAALRWLAEAEAAVRDDRVRLYRVRAEKLCVLFGDLNARNPYNENLAVPVETFAARLAEFCEIGRALRIAQFVRRLPTADWLHRVARLRPERTPWYADPLIARLIADPGRTLANEQRRHSQTPVARGTEVELGGRRGWRLELDGFRGGRGPQEYAHLCEPRNAVWIYGPNLRNPEMWTVLHLDGAPRGEARLAVVAQDDDKPGAVRLRITVNGTGIFTGPSPFAERGWSSAEFPIPRGVLKAGDNDIRFETLDASTAADQGWFMLAECTVFVEGE